MQQLSREPPNPGVRMRPQPARVRLRNARAYVPLPPIQPELDHPGGNLAGAVAARFAADLEFRRQGVEPALRGALGDVQLGGDLGPRRRTAR